jgi:hypothetical protein
MRRLGFPAGERGAFACGFRAVRSFLCLICRLRRQVKATPPASGTVTAPAPSLQEGDQYQRLTGERASRFLGGRT